MAFPLEVFSAYYQLRNLTDIFESCCEEKKKEQKLMDLDRGPLDLKASELTIELPQSSLVEYAPK